MRMSGGQEDSWRGGGENGVVPDSHDQSEKSLHQVAPGVNQIPEYGEGEG